ELGPESDTEAVFQNPQKAKDLIIRTKVKRLTGTSANLTLRFDRGFYYTAFFNGHGHFGIGKSTFENDKWGFHHLQDYQAAETFDDEFFEFAFAALGDRLTVYANGKQILSVRDSSHQAGIATIWAYEGRSQFKDLEVQILKPAD